MRGRGRDERRREHGRHQARVRRSMCKGEWAEEHGVGIRKGGWGLVYSIVSTDMDFSCVVFKKVADQVLKILLYLGTGRF